MEFGVSVPNIHRPGGREAIREIALAADALGYHSVWMGDHIVVPPGGGNWGSDMFTGELYEVFTTAGYVAALTERVRIGFGVIVLPWRGAVVTAKMIATLDNLSQGRIIFGIGIGGVGVESHALGVNPKTRGDLANEYINAFRVLWGSEQPVFHGRFVDFEGIQFKPLPVQKPLPIWVGGISDAAYRRTVELCEGWHWHADVEQFLPELEKLERLASQHGRDISTIAIANQPPIRFADKPTKAPDLYYPAAARTKPNPPLIGPPDYIADLMNQFAEMGVTHTICDLHIHEWYYDDPLPEVLRAMETFAVKVRPQVTATRNRQPATV